MGIQESLETKIIQDHILKDYGTPSYNVQFLDKKVEENFLHYKEKAQIQEGRADDFKPKKSVKELLKEIQYYGPQKLLPENIQKGRKDDWTPIWKYIDEMEMDKDMYLKGAPQFPWYKLEEIKKC